jgi:hypothetical protein
MRHPRFVFATAFIFTTPALVGCGSGGGVDASGTTGIITGAGGAGGGSASTSTSTSSIAGGGGSAAGSGGNGTSSGGGGFGAGGAWCGPIPACDAPPPDPGGEVDWNHFSTEITVTLGGPNHRGRDLFLNPGDPQWIIGKFAYGINDDDIQDEQVDIYLLRDCTTWEFLGSTNTTDDDEHATVEGVDDTGGRVYFEIPSNKLLGPGRHKVRLVVRGDLSSTELFIEVVPPGTPVVVTDVDGTLTTDEYAEFPALLSGDLPDVHADAAAVFGVFAAKGYHPMYLTARPEWLVERTREFVSAKGFPSGIVHTTTTLTGAVGSSAADYKTEELAMLAGKGIVPAWAFGNSDTDAEGYDNGSIAPLSHRIYFQFDDSVYGGRRIESYTDLLAELSALPDLCP